MNIRLLLIGLIINCATYAQKVVHTSYHVLAINGSWDVGKDPQRAHFVSGNKNIQSIFINNFSVTRERRDRVKSGFVELKFIVRSNGKLDSVEFVKHDDAVNDYEAIRLLSLTDGAWRSGQIGGKKIDEKMIIRFYFSDNAKAKNADKSISKAKESFDKDSFENCVKFCNQSLEINPFETEILKLKGISLLKLGRKNESCEVLTLAQNYYAENIEELISNSCK